LLVSAGGMTLAMPAATLAATPSCGGHPRTTPRQTEGPYFTPNSPSRASLLEKDMPGTRLVLSGRVLAADCAPLSAVLLDFWQADAGGTYDNRGYRLRGHQFSDDQGRFRLETVLPGIYPGRTRHIHVKVQAANGPVLTTQLYFPGELRNSADSIFSPALLVTVAEQPGDRTDRRPQQPPAGPADAGPAMDASFDFVIATG
jgi:protocatechuate 3,4-dioxygenase beta subunit